MAGLPSSAVPQPLASLVTENCPLDLMFLADVSERRQQEAVVFAGGPCVS